MRNLVFALIAGVALIACDTSVVQAQVTLKNGSVVQGDVIADDGKVVTVKYSSPVGTIVRYVDKSDIAGNVQVNADAAQAAAKNAADIAAKNAKAIQAARNAAWAKNGQQYQELDKQITQLRATQDADADAVKKLRAELDRQIDLLDAHHQAEYIQEPPVANASFNQPGFVNLSAVETDELMAIANLQSVFLGQVAPLQADEAAAESQADKLIEAQKSLLPLGRP